MVELKRIVHANLSSVEETLLKVKMILIYGLIQFV